MPHALCEPGAHHQAHAALSAVNVTVLGDTHQLYCHVHQRYGLNDAFDRSVGVLLEEQQAQQAQAQRAFGDGRKNVGTGGGGDGHGGGGGEGLPRRRRTLSAASTARMTRRMECSRAQGQGAGCSAYDGAMAAWERRLEREAAERLQVCTARVLCCARCAALC